VELALLGYNGISIGAFLLFTLAPTSAAMQGGVLAFVFACNIAAVLLFKFSIPDVQFEASEDTFKTFLGNIVRHFREWLPAVWPYLVCMFVNMFGVILMTGVVLYIFDGDDVPLWPGHNAPTLPTNTFQALYNVCSFLGDFSSRRFVYKKQRTFHPALLLLLIAAGLGLGLCRVAILAWVGMFLVMFANGALYAATMRHVDANVPRQFNLTIFSLWLFVGDCGSFAASYTTDYIAALVG
jgi:hypothetical protein